MAGLMPGLALAADAAPPLTLASLKAATDMAWVVAAGALVFFMQAGFAFLESGMARSKNTVNVIMKNYCDMCFGAVAYWVLGYGLMFGLNESGWLGTTGFAPHMVSDSEYGALFFQTMFAATSATIVSGAIAERARFSAYIVGSVLITGLIYPVYGSWVWAPPMGERAGSGNWVSSISRAPAWSMRWAVGRRWQRFWWSARARGASGPMASRARSWGTTCRWCRWAPSACWPCCGASF